MNVYFFTIKVNAQLNAHYLKSECPLPFYHLFFYLTTFLLSLSKKGNTGCKLVNIIIP